MVGVGRRAADTSGWVEERGAKASPTQVEAHDPHQAMLPQLPEVRFAARLEQLEAAVGLVHERLTRIEGGNVVALRPPRVSDVAAAVGRSDMLGPLDGVPVVPAGASLSVVTPGPAPVGSTTTAPIPAERPPWWGVNEPWPPRF